MGMVQHTETSIMEAAIGDAKYEHVYRALVWRIPKLPEKHHGDFDNQIRFFIFKSKSVIGAYKTHLLRCRFQLSSFDLMPDSFIPHLDVDFTMPMATVSNTVVRSVSIEQHEDPERVEKWVRYLAKYQYKVSSQIKRSYTGTNKQLESNQVEIDYVQTTDLDMDAIMDASNLEPEKASETVPAPHRPSIDVEIGKDVHGGYETCSCYL